MIPAPDARWLAVGSSMLGDSYDAGAQAASEALRYDDPKLLLLFSSDRHDLPRLTRAVTEASGGTPMIGCTTGGELCAGGPSDGGVVVAALGGSGFQTATSVATEVAGRYREAGAEVAECAAGLTGGAHQVLIMLIDGSLRSHQEILRGAYSVLGASVPLFGGCAGRADVTTGGSLVLEGERLVPGGVAAAALGSTSPFGIGVKHGCRKLGQPVLVSGSVESVVHSLDDEPALDTYLRRLDAPAAAWTDASAFVKFAFTHPLSLKRRGGEEMRYVVEANMTDRSLICAADVPQGGLLWFTESSPESVLAAADTAVTTALDGLAGTPPIGFLAFDCVSRRGVLGPEGSRREVEHIMNRAGGAPVAGCYTFGEVARVRGITGYHNQTLVVLAVS
jgi:hypothetical protein